MPTEIEGICTFVVIVTIRMIQRNLRTDGMATTGERWHNGDEEHWRTAQEMIVEVDKHVARLLFV